LNAVTTYTVNCRKKVKNSGIFDAKNGKVTPIEEVINEDSVNISYFSS